VKRLGPMFDLVAAGCASASSARTSARVIFLRTLTTVWVDSLRGHTKRLLQGLCCFLAFGLLPSLRSDVRKRNRMLPAERNSQ
jgi:hypothetical protein